MAGRFPGSDDIEQFWDSLCRGKESIRALSDTELDSLGVARHRFTAANYVRAHGVLSHADGFDAPFFGFSAREAELIDPQQRVFLECAWAALENAGYDPERYTGLIGVYAGAGWNSYLLRAVQADPGLLDSEAGHQLLLGNDKDHLATRVSYKLNLRGPSLTIQTACSTSLVAVVTAYQSLLTFDCDIALAGGVSVTWPQEGYVYQPGGILSLDGHCRAFDASARGTVLGSGAGVVVMKRLEDALADRDHIYAVIRGAALGNDGASKAGYTAPSVEGQARVIIEAQRIAGVHPDTIDYVETHGTGTELGDPIEAKGLISAFGSGALRKRSCALGAVKTNIGHLDAAAGVAGLIKTTLALHHRQIPPSLHFDTYNPQTELADSPFYVNTTLAPWDTGSLPRRAGVSSFGLGGTNAHVIVEEAPSSAPVAGPAIQLVVVSARTAEAMDRASLALADHLERDPKIDLADAAYTLQVGRRPFAHRTLVLCEDAATTAVALRARGPEADVRTAAAKHRCKGAVLAFSGQGTQHVNMARMLYRDEPRFRRHADHCFELLAERCGLELRSVIYPEQASDELRSRLAQTDHAQPALFTIEYALAQMWIDLGIDVQSAIGHSLGEYAAATIASVLSLEDALWLVAERGRLLQALPPGAMLAVPLPEADVAPLLGTHLSLAAVNEARACVVSGPTDAVSALHERLEAQGTSSRYLEMSHAFHSAMLDPVLAQFEARVRRVRLHAPTLPYVSTLTAGWITAAEATDPRYWVRHLRDTVRFADGLARLLEDTDGPVLEIGPGRTLTQLVKRHPSRAGDRLAVASLPGAPEPTSGRRAALATVGELWLAGLDIDWDRHHRDQPRRRVPLPTYRFDRQRYVLAALARRAAGDQAPDAPELWVAVVESMAAEAESVCRAIDHELRQDQDAALSRIALHHMTHALAALAALPDKDAGSSAEALLARSGIVPRYRPLVLGWLELLVQAGHLVRDDRGHLTAGRQDSTSSRDELARRVAALWSDAPQVIDLVRRCGDSLVAVLRGDTDATEIFASVLDASEQAPQGEIAMRTHYTQILRRGVARLASALPARSTLRVLEIGGGSGIATSELLPLLPAGRTEYQFTDLAKLFLSQARHKFSGYPFVTYRTLNIEVSPEDQGYGAQTFDVIVAVNVLHAVGSIAATLQHVRSLLAPGGLLLIGELTRPTADFAMTYGLLMNRVDDAWRDPANPFLSPERWKAALAAAGFADVATFPGGDVLDQHVILARAAGGAATQAFAVPPAIAPGPTGLVKKQDPADWFYVPSWRRTGAPAAAPGGPVASARWLVFVAERGPGRAIADALARAGDEVVTVTADERYGSRDADHYAIDPARPEHYAALLAELKQWNRIPHKIAHAWSACPVDAGLDRASVEAAQAVGLKSLMFLGQAIGSQELVEPLTLWIVSSGAHGIAGDEVVPARATLLAAAKVLPLEYPNVSCASVDLDAPATEPLAPALLAQLVDELQAEPADRVVAYRGRHRWIPGVEPIRLRGRRAAKRLRPRGVYLVTGGLGKLGLVVAEHLAKAVGARLILAGRSQFPDRHAWEPWLASHDRDDPTSRKIAQVRALEALGAEVVIEIADVTRLDDMRSVVERARQRWGAIDGVIHSAGLLGDGVIQSKTLAELDAVLAPKVTGTLVLDELFRDQPLDFFVSFSSLSAQMPAFGQLAYSAANNFLEQYTARRLGDGRRFTACISWDVWQGDGMAYHAAGPSALRALKEADFERRGILPAEGAAVFGWVLESDVPHVLVSTSDYLAVAEAYAHDFAQVYLDELKTATSASRHHRPDLPTPYVRPHNDTEVTLGAIWEELLGIAGLGADDDFFELGGDSLIGTQLMTRIKRACGVKLSTKVLYDRRTIRRLSEAIEDAVIAQASDEAFRLALEQLEQAK